MGDFKPWILPSRAERDLVLFYTGIFMPGLEQFQCDLFLSYGWAGIRTPDEADRGWVGEFKVQLESQLSGALGRQARIFLDVEQSKNGELPANLKSAVSSSALFLSVISPGSCRPDSWCRFELNAFVGEAGSLLPHSGQLFSVLMRDVRQQEWPEQLHPVVPYEFLDDASPRLTLPREDLSHTNTPAGKLVQRLAMDIAKALAGLELQIARTVFLAQEQPALADRASRLAIEIDKRGGGVIRVREIPGESETDYVERTRRALRRCGLSIHLLAESADPIAPAWSDSPQGLQIREAAARFGSERNRMILWHEAGPAPGIEAAATRSAQILQGTGFEDLENIVRDCLRGSVALGKARTESADAQVPAAAAGSATGNKPSSPLFVYVECVQQDLPKLKRLRALLEQKGIRIQAPLFEGDESLRRRVNEEFLKNDHFQQCCRAVAVYFGSRNDLEAFVACRLLDDALHDRRPSLPKVILLDPYDDPVHSFFSYPEFESFPSSRLEELVKRIL